MSNDRKYYDISYQITGAMYHVANTLGPGLLERVYQKALVRELLNLGFKVEEQKPIKAKINGEDLGLAYYADIVVNDSVIIELKSVQEITDVHRAQILNYLHLSDIEFGMLVNFYYRLTHIERYRSSKQRNH